MFSQRECVQNVDCRVVSDSTFWLVNDETHQKQHWMINILFVLWALPKLQQCFSWEVFPSWLSPAHAYWVIATLWWIQGGWGETQYVQRFRHLGCASHIDHFFDSQLHLIIRPKINVLFYWAASLLYLDTSATFTKKYHDLYYPHGNIDWLPWHASRNVQYEM